MSNALEASKSLIRTAVRTFWNNPRQILVVDALLTYNAMAITEMVNIFPYGTQPKEIRSLLTPLRNARLVSIGLRNEIKEGSTRASQREYYFVNYHHAIDAIKFKFIKLQQRVQDLYKEEQGRRRDWSCPRCGNEYDEMAILDKVNDKGFYCERCGETLDQNEAAVRERGEHAKIRHLNDQLRPFNALLAVIDAGEVPENAFEDAWANKRNMKLRDDKTGDGRARYIGLSNQHGMNDGGTRKMQESVDAGAVAIDIKDEKSRALADAEAKKIKMEQAAKQNVLPAWHTSSAIREDVKTEGGASPGGSFLKREDEDEKKPELQEERKVQEELDAYVAEMERERVERERKEAEEASDEEDDDDDEDDFEDALGGSTVGTPISSQQQSSLKQEITPTKSRMNGLKRDFDDAESISGTDTGANTPAPADTGPTSMPDAKRLKLDHGNNTAVKIGIATQQANGPAADSDEDEDFEDV